MVDEGGRFCHTIRMGREVVIALAPVCEPERPVLSAQAKGLGTG